MKIAQNKYFYLGVVLFITTAGILLCIKYMSLKAQLSQEFELTVQGASLAFIESVNRHVEYLHQNLDESSRNLELSLISQAEELDGYFSRMSQGEADIAKNVSNTFEEAYEIHIYPPVDDFQKIYLKGVTQLEEDLLLRSDCPFPFVTFSTENNELNQFSQRVTDVLRSPKGLIVKVVDDSFEWVPIVGDAWGFLKMVYDPRKENIENKISEVTDALRFSINQKIQQYSELTASDIEKICVESFDGNYAVIYYLYLTYIRS